MNKKELQIKGSLAIIEQNVKDLKLSINNLLNQKNLSRTTGARVYSFQHSFSGGAKKDQSEIVQNLLDCNISKLNNLRTEIDRLQAHLLESVDSQIPSQTGVTKTLPVMPRQIGNTSKLPIYNYKANERNQVSSIKNMTNTSKLMHPTNFKNMSTVNNTSYASFQKPAPRIHQNSQKPIITSKISKIANSSHVSNIPKPIISNMRSLVNPMRDNSILKRSVPSNQYSSGVHSVESSKLPLGGIEKLLTPIQKTRVQDSNHNIQTDIPLANLTNIEEKQDIKPIITELIKPIVPELIKHSNFEKINKIQNIHENLDPELLEKLGDQTMAECFAMLEKTYIT